MVSAKIESHLGGASLGKQTLSDTVARLARIDRLVKYLRRANLQLGRLARVRPFNRSGSSRLFLGRCPELSWPTVCSAIVFEMFVMDIRHRANRRRSSQESEAWQHAIRRLRGYRWQHVRSTYLNPRLSELACCPIQEYHTVVLE